MPAIENPTVASDSTHIGHELEADLGGEHRSSAGGGVQDVEANVKQSTDAVKYAVPKAKTPGDGDQALAEANAYYVDGSSSADNDSDTLINGTDDSRLSGKEGESTDSNSISDSDNDSDSDSGVDFWARYQPRGDGDNGYSGKKAPADSGLKSSGTKTSKSRSATQSTSQAQNSTATDKSSKADNKSSKPGKSSKRN